MNLHTQRVGTDKQKWCEMLWRGKCEINICCALCEHKFQLPNAILEYLFTKILVIAKSYFYNHYCKIFLNFSYLFHDLFAKISSTQNC